MGVEYLLVNLTKRRYVDPGTVGSGSKRDGVSQGLFPEMITRLMLDEWRGDHVVLVGDAAESEEALVREIHKCDPPEDLSFGQCSCGSYMKTEDRSNL